MRILFLGKAQTDIQAVLLVILTGELDSARDLEVQKVRIQKILTGETRFACPRQR